MLLRIMPMVVTTI